MVALLRAQRKNRGPVMPGSTGHPPESKRHSLMSQELLVHQNAVAEKKQVDYPCSVEGERAVLSSRAVASVLQGAG